MSLFTNMKIRCKTAEHTSQILQLLTDDGHNWPDAGRVPHGSVNFFYTSDDGVISYGSTDEHFNTYPAREYQLIDNVITARSVAFKEMKFSCNGVIHNMEIQTALYELGYSWYHADIGAYSWEYYIFTDARGNMKRSSVDSTFDFDPSPRHWCVAGVISPYPPTA